MRRKLRNVVMQKAIEKLERFPRLRLGFYPTPLQEMLRLREVLGKTCPRLFIKRDDFTGFGFGGNKIRKQEFLLAKLLQDGVETVITTGGERSNHARMTAFVCAKLGIKCVLVLDRKPRPEGTESFKPASTFLEELLNAEVHIVNSIAERKAKASEIFNHLKQSGQKVYEIPLGGASAISTLGFVSAMRELSEQMRFLNVDFNHLFFSSSTAGTHAGMLVGANLFGLENLRIIGISPEPDAKKEIVSEIEKLLFEVGELLETKTVHLAEKIEILEEYAGQDYCVETAEANDSFKLLASKEAVILDSVYTAKAMTGLIDWVQRGKLNERDNVVFWHTGGQMTQFYVP